MDSHFWDLMVHLCFIIWMGLDLVTHRKQRQINECVANILQEMKKNEKVQNTKK